MSCMSIVTLLVVLLQRVRIVCIGLPLKILLLGSGGIGIKTFQMGCKTIKKVKSII